MIYSYVGVCNSCLWAKKGVVVWVEWCGVGDGIWGVLGVVVFVGQSDEELLLLLREYIYIMCRIFSRNLAPWFPKTQRGICVGGCGATKHHPHNTPSKLHTRKQKEKTDCNDKKEQEQQKQHTPTTTMTTTTKKKKKKKTQAREREIFRNILHISFNRHTQHTQRHTHTRNKNKQTKTDVLLLVYIVVF